MSILFIDLFYGQPTKDLKFNVTNIKFLTYCFHATDVMNIRKVNRSHNDNVIP